MPRFKSKVDFSSVSKTFAAPPENVYSGAPFLLVEEVGLEARKVIFSYLLFL